MDGNLTREGITADFEALARAGIGGVLMMEVDVGIPRGPVEFMSPEWRRLFKHAVTEAERLGLQITLNAGPGWTGSGGPWVKPEQSMQHLVGRAVELQGPQSFDDVLPRPERRPAFFGDGALPPALERAKNEYYREVAVLAFPTPMRGARIADLDEKALYVRAPYSSQPGVKAALPAPGRYPSLAADAVVSASQVQDLTEKLSPDGRLQWEVPAGDWTVLRLGATSTGANTRPAPAPGLGLESDKFDGAALEAHFEAFVGTLLREIGPRPRSRRSGWTMLHIDSWEMGAQNWTARFAEEFRQRRGYALKPYLPVLTGRVVNSPEQSERFLWDLRVTAQELVIENHAQRLRSLGRRHGFGLSIEPYDMNPCADLSLGGVADVPMCEFWLYGFETSYSVIEAASIAHTLGRPIVAAEAFTSTDAERWLAYPATMKALGDWAFCGGVNRIVFHRYQHQPWLDRRPGMTMGPYGVHWERTQTWWDLVPAYHRYLARCQFLLRQGLAVADVCFLAAEGAPHVFRPPASATRGTPPDRLGYSFDGCAPETLLARGMVRRGRLVMPDGMSYRVLVLPERETMTPALLRRIRDLVRAGATVIGPPPVKSPSLSGYPGCDDEVRALATELWGEVAGASARERSVGRGRVIRDGPSVRTTNSAGWSPNAWSEARWIWYPEGQPAVKAPVGSRFFRRIVTLSETQPVESARLVVTADNGFKVWCNGQLVGQGDNFHQAYLVDLSHVLKAGTNLVAIGADNGGDSPNPAGLIAALQVRFRGGGVTEVPTDRTWETAREVVADWTVNVAAGVEWSSAAELGAYDVAPWNHTGPPQPPEEQYGDFATAVRALGEMGVPPDFESDQPIRYTHRRSGTVDLYFVANPSDRVCTGSCVFRVKGRTPELWHPVTGQTRELAGFKTAGDRTVIPLRFEPHESYFVVFRGPVRTRRSEPSRPDFPEFHPVQPLKGPWTVRFDPKFGGPGRVEFADLTDWSQHDDPRVRFYSGTATYETSWDFPESERKGRGAVYLDLGRVRNLASVKLNGRDLGVVWCAPWRVEITAAVRPAGNRLEITVANLWPNRLIGDQAVPAEQRLTWTTWNPYRADSPLVESGLLGPVTVGIAE